MGFSVRVFLLNEKGELNRFSYARFQRLSKHDPTESLPDYADAHARFAIAYIRTIDGEPSELQHVDYVRLEIGPDGRFDEESERRGLFLAAGSIDLPQPSSAPKTLIRAEHVFNRRQYQHEFTWKPSAHQQQNLVRLIKEQWRKAPPR